MISVLVTGANGQLGNELRRMSAEFPLISCLFTDVEELDITNQAAISDFLDKNRLQYLVNAAAYTAVDGAEDEPDLAMLLNRDAVKTLSEETSRRNIQLIHISTDYVFDGEKHHPYLEDDPVNPQTEYGRTKLAGEEMLRKTGNGIIIRTSWMYSAYGFNFVKTILRLSRERDQLSVVFDQTGCPTNARDLALVIFNMIGRNHDLRKKLRYEIYHYSNMGICSWYEFAEHIVELSGENCKVLPVESKDYPTKTPRPRYSVLDKSKLLKEYGIQIPHWKDSLIAAIPELITGLEN